MAQRHNRIHSATGTGMALAFAWSFVGGGTGGNQRNFDSPKHEYTRTLMDAAFMQELWRLTYSSLSRLIARIIRCWNWNA